MNTPKLTLIIAFYNKIELLRKVLESVALQTMRDFEVVIADDGSKPEVVEAIKSLQTQFAFPISHVWHEDQGWRLRGLQRLIDFAYPAPWFSWGRIWHSSPRGN